MVINKHPEMEGRSEMATNETQLTCCCCGGNAGRWKQHWNRDSGYGICSACVAEESVRNTSEQIESYYGKPGINYDQPMVRYLGKRYRVLAATKKENLADVFIGRTPNAAVLTVFDDGTIIIADKTDEGEPVKA